MKLWRGGERKYPNKFSVVIGGTPYQLVVSDVTYPWMPEHDERIHIVLEVPPEMRVEVRRALAPSHGWKLRSRWALFLWKSSLVPLRELAKATPSFLFIVRKL
jgi:hypothetical protein